jgi:hypothetical protein
VSRRVTGHPGAFGEGMIWLAPDMSAVARSTRGGTRGIVISGADKGVPMPYLTNAGPRSGPILCRDRYDAIDVLVGPDDRTPVGTATPVGCTEGGIVVWDIIIRGRVMPGRWIVLSRQFLLKR